MLEGPLGIRCHYCRDMGFYKARLLNSRYVMRWDCGIPQILEAASADIRGGFGVVEGRVKYRYPRSLTAHLQSQVTKGSSVRRGGLRRKEGGLCRERGGGLSSRGLCREEEGRGSVEKREEGSIVKTDGLCRRERGLCHKKWGSFEKKALLSREVRCCKKSL